MYEDLNWVAESTAPQGRCGNICAHAWPLMCCEGSVRGRFSLPDFYSSGLNLPIYMGMAYAWHLDPVLAFVIFGLGYEATRATRSVPVASTRCSAAESLLRLWCEHRLTCW